MKKLKLNQALNKGISDAFNFHMNPWVIYLEIQSAGTPLTEVIPLTKSQNPDFGFPEGRLHQTERAGIFHLYIYIYIYTHRHIHIIHTYMYIHIPYMDPGRHRARGPARGCRMYIYVCICICLCICICILGMVPILSR